MQLNTELANQIRLISGNQDLMKKALEYLKGLTAQLSPTAKKVNETEKTKKWLDSFVGKWEDDNTPGEMVAEIYNSRKSNSQEDLIDILNK
ncbi:MAG: hypothetical protein ACI4T9_06335 [Prevotella sp.]